MVQAYILVQTEVGKAADVATSIGKINGVRQADDVTGPYDVIVRAESDNVDDLGKLVVAQIQSVPGITRTSPARSCTSERQPRTGWQPGGRQGSSSPEKRRPCGPRRACL